MSLCQLDEVLTFSWAQEIVVPAVQVVTSGSQVHPRPAKEVHQVQKLGCRSCSLLLGQVDTAVWQLQLRLCKLRCTL